MMILMGATHVSIPLRKHFNGVPNREITSPFILSSTVSSPSSPTGLLENMEVAQMSENHEMEGSVSHALLSYDFEAAVFLDSSFLGHGPRRHVFIFLGQTEVQDASLAPRSPPSAPRRPQTDACWGTRPTPAGTASARLPRLATTVVAVVGVAPCWPQRIRTVTTHTPAPRLGALPHLCLTPVPNLSREAGSSVDPGRARPGHLSKPS